MKHFAHEKKGLSRSETTSLDAADHKDWRVD